jgi:cell division GTPase FtsZ
MKPDGRSLDIAVIGLGQAGGNLAAEFYRRGYRSIAFNTAQTDLAALDPGGLFPTLPPERRHYIGLDGYDGAGADPDYGRMCIVEHSERVRQIVAKHCDQADAVLVTAGLGGGTGSAVAELVHALEEDQLPLLALMTLPTENESGIAKVNAVRAINDIVETELLGWIFVDNHRISTLNPDISIVDYFAHINGQIASPIDALNRLNDRGKLKPIRSFDGEDYRKLLLSGGVLNYSVTELPEITVEEVVGTVKDSIEASELMPAGFDIKKLSYLGLVIEAPEPALADTPIAVFEEISDQLKRLSEGAAIYHGLYKTDEKKTLVRLIAATQSLPSRIRQLLADAKREGMILGEKIREDLPNLELGEIANVELFRKRTRPSNRPHKGGGGRVSKPLPPIDDVAMEIGRRPKPAAKDEHDDGPKRDPRGRPRPKIAEEKASQLEAKPTRRRPEPQKPSGLKELGTEEIDVVAQLAQLGDFDEDDGNELNETAPAINRKELDEQILQQATKNGEVPNAEVYDGLVATYLHAKSAKDREGVVKRLEGDAVSEHTVIRYYAVEAMAKLGRKVFGHALLNATEDENEAVRNLAVEALKR